MVFGQSSVLATAGPAICKWRRLLPCGNPLRSVPERCSPPAAGGVSRVFLVIVLVSFFFCCVGGQGTVVPSHSRAPGAVLACQRTRKRLASEVIRFLVCLIRERARARLSLVQATPPRLHESNTPAVMAMEDSEGGARGPGHFRWKGHLFWIVAEARHPGACKGCAPRCMQGPVLPPRAPVSSRHPFSHRFAPFHESSDHKIVAEGRVRGVSQRAVGLCRK